MKTTIRKFDDYQRIQKHINEIFKVEASIHFFYQHQSLYSRFFFFIDLVFFGRSLGLLNYLHIWHDNTGEESFASWFLKCIVIKDLQTKEVFYFIAQRWFAVEKDDGKVS